jgi:hypothetical protein
MGALSAIPLPLAARAARGPLKHRQPCPERPPRRTTRLNASFLAAAYYTTDAGSRPWRQWAGAPAARLPACLPARLPAGPAGPRRLQAAPRPHSLSSTPSGSSRSPAARSCSARPRSTRPARSRLRHLSLRSTLGVCVGGWGERGGGGAGWGEAGRRKGAEGVRCAGCRPQHRPPALEALAARPRRGLPRRRTCVRPVKPSAPSSRIFRQWPGPCCGAGRVRQRGCRFRLKLPAATPSTRPTAGCPAPAPPAGPGPMALAPMKAPKPPLTPTL